MSYCLTLFFKTPFQVFHLLFVVGQEYTKGEQKSIGFSQKFTLGVDKPKKLWYAEFTESELEEVN